MNLEIDVEIHDIANAFTMEDEEEMLVELCSQMSVDQMMDIISKHCGEDKIIEYVLDNGIMDHLLKEEEA